MNENLVLTPIAYIESDFKSKFGIPRQSCLVTEHLSTVIFEKEFRDRNALRGLEGYSHIWLLWGFSEIKMDHWTPMVKPPKLGGNTKMGVFATRSPFRPNPIGLSSVKLEKIEEINGKGLALVVSGADLMDGTPIYDIKPYLSFSDSHPDAKNGFSDKTRDHRIPVEIPDSLLDKIPENKREALVQTLSLDPRPGYLTNEEYPYGFPFGGYDVRFRVTEGTLRVFELVCISDGTVYSEDI